MDILSITRSQADGIVCYADLSNDEETTLVWYDPATLRGEVYEISFSDDTIEIEKGDIAPDMKFDFTPFEKITLEMFDNLSAEINQTISEAEVVEEGL